MALSEFSQGVLREMVAAHGFAAVRSAVELMGPPRAGRHPASRFVGVPAESNHSPAYDAGERADGRCHGCRRKIPDTPGYAKQALYCGTCRWRGSTHGWCECGSALYAGGWCKPKAREAKKWHREQEAEA